MHAGRVLVLGAGGVAAVLVVRRALDNATPPSSAASPVTLAPQPNLLLRLFERFGRPSGGEVRGVNLLRPAVQDIPGFGRGIDLTPIRPTTLLAPAALEPPGPLAPDGGGPGGIGVAAVGATIAPSDMTTAQLTLAASKIGDEANPAYSASLPGVPALTALMSGNLFGFAQAMLTAVLNAFEANPKVDVPGVGPISASRAIGEAAGKVLSLFGITLPSMGPVPQAITALSLRGGAFAANAEVQAELAEEGYPALAITIGEVQAAVRANPALAADIISAGPTFAGAPPGTHSIPGFNPNVFFTDFTLRAVDPQGRPFGAATGNAPTDSTNFGRTNTPPAQPDFTVQIEVHTPDEPDPTQGESGPPSNPAAPAPAPGETMGEPSTTPAPAPAPSGQGEAGGPGPGQGGGIGSGEAGAPGSGGTGAGASPGD